MVDDAWDGGSVPPASAPALGAVEPVSRRRRINVAVIVVAAVAAMLLVRSTGLLREDTSLPPLREVTLVEPGIVRGAQPKDIELLRLRDDYGVRGVVAVDGASTEEQAAVRTLRIPLLEIDVPTDTPTADQLLTIIQFLKEVDPDRDDGDGFVYLHDVMGTGPVLVTGLMLEVLNGEPLPVVLENLDPAVRARLSLAQNQALAEVAAAANGDVGAAGVYGVLIGVTI